jgi:hypothetical protein
MPGPSETSDYLLLGGKRTPGSVKLSGHGRAEKWDVKEGDGQGGATVTYKGEELSKFTATFELGDGDDYDDFADWDAFVPILRRATGAKEPSALDVFHPDLARLDIKSVVVTKIGGLVHDGKGGATVAVDFLEYRPPVPKGGTPNGSSANAGAAGGAAGGAQDPNADAQAEIDALLEEAKKP